MFTAEERELFLKHGYLHARGVLNPERWEQVQSEFDRVWDLQRPCNQHELLKHQTFIDLIEHPAILGRHRAIFGDQVQLLQYDFLRQGPRNEGFPIRAWHRDFVFPGDHPIAINTILYMDHMTDERGPTYVLPGTHRGPHLPPRESVNLPQKGEIAVHAAPGDAVFINSAIWHSGSRNRSDGPRRAIYFYYGYWWLKPYEAHQQRPWQCLVNASPERLQLLGVKMPAGDIHQYDPEAGLV